MFRFTDVLAIKYPDLFQKHFCLYCQSIGAKDRLQLKNIDTKL
jgi:hypothetical protein